MIMPIIEDLKAYAERAVGRGFPGLGAYPPTGTYDVCTSAQDRPERSSQSQSRLAAKGSDLRKRRIPVEALKRPK